ncbi:MAG: arsenate reductase (glutaredoxin) [Pseudomonadota bacterium]
MTTIYHNPRCSKSRQTLALLEEAGITPTVVRYLESPLSREQLADLIERSGRPVSDFFRAGEAQAKAQGLTVKSAPEALLDSIAAEPKLMERPIVVTDKGVALGRPPERVREIL